MVDIYTLKVSKNLDNNTVERLLSYIERPKQERIKRFRRPEDAMRTLFADLLARRVIIEKLGMRNEDIIFGTNEYGKPYLKNVPGFHFNVSHSGDWVVCAADSKPIGVDIEKIEPIDLDISAHYFSPDEHSDLLKKPDRLDYFFTLWTLKEAYIKIEGKGLSLPLNSFSIRFAENEIGIEAGGHRLRDTFFNQYQIDVSYKMAVCAHTNNFPNSVNSRTMGELTYRFTGDLRYMNN